MLRFAKVNLLSFLFALPLAIQTQLMIRAVQLESRVPFFTSGRTSTLLFFIFAAASLLLVLFIRRHLAGDRLRYGSALLWIPYYALLMALCNRTLHAIQPQDKLAPGAGIILLGVLALYPIYALLLNLAGFSFENRSASNA